MTYTRPDYHRHILPLECEGFSGKPDEIWALRKALGLTQGEFGKLLGVYADRKGICRGVLFWERGYHRPMPVFRRMMVRMVATAGDAYKEFLEKAKDRKPTGGYTKSKYMLKKEDYLLPKLRSASVKREADRKRRMADEAARTVVDSEAVCEGAKRD